MLWRFEPHPEQLEPLIAHHHPGLVVLAIVLAVLAASTLLPVLERYRSAQTASAAIGWVLAGAIAMGCGVWAMHFTAMLAHRLPAPVSYDPGITLLSILPIAVGAAGTFVVARVRRLSRQRRLMLAALSFGLGCGAMHYLGMEALIAPVDMVYDPVLFSLSLVVVVVMAWLGLASNLFLLNRFVRRWPAYLVGAVILGLSVTAMHYVAMSATAFYSAPVKAVVGLQMSHQVLGVLVAVAVIVIVALLLLAVLVDRRFSHIARSLSSSERRFELLAETSESGIFTCNHAFDYTNPAMSQITGYSEGELHQMPVAELLGFEPERELARREDGEHLYRETFITTKQGDCRWLYVTLGRLHGDGVQRYLGSVFDITERKQMEQELRYLAFNDPLTDLPNRKFFMSRLNGLMDGVSVPGDGRAWSPAFTVMFVDVNRFKLINDNFGLSKGDQLLKVIARRIKSALPRALLVSRVGGDEFALLFEGAAQVKWVEREAERLHEVFERAFRLGEQEFFLSLSIGVAHYQSRYTDAEQLYRDATLAKDAAKKEGLGVTCVFDHAMQRNAQRHLAMERDLRQALQRESFELLYQPIVNLPDGEVRGFEALVRWRAEDGSLIGPGEFIPLAEETGLINSLGDWVLREACRQIGQWRLEPGIDSSGFYVSVNLSSVQFFQTGLIDTVHSAMEQHGVKPGQLKLELTEGILVDDNPQVIERMRQLLAMGCGILVDDFGTGYSSLSYLQRFPIETLKIDQSFTAKLDENTGLHLVRAIVSMAHALELGVVAEGIESEAVAESLVALGCELGQGYYFDPPLSPEQAAARLLPRAASYAQGALFQ